MTNAPTAPGIDPVLRLPDFPWFDVDAIAPDGWRDEAEALHAAAADLATHVRTFARQYGPVYRDLWRWVDQVDLSAGTDVDDDYGALWSVLRAATGANVIGDLLAYSQNLLAMVDEPNPESNPYRQKLVDRFGGLDTEVQA